jgi:DNA-directed RNA polymerase subunit beta'
MIEGVSVEETVDEATGITSKIVKDFRVGTKTSDLRPRITLMDEKDGTIEAARYFLAVDAILSVAEGDKVNAGDIVARIPLESAKTRDITGGLPRVAELFEARKPKDHAVIAQTAGRIEFGKDYKAKRRVIIRPEDEEMEPVEYMIPKGKHIAVQEGDYVQRGDYLLDGNPDPHDILDVLGVAALAEYLVNEIQEVYRLQGVKINDKHIEVIVRQMLQKVEVTHSGDTIMLVGEQMDREEFDEENAKVQVNGGEPAKGKPILLGITKASLQTKSFISAASFQETTRVLTEASVQGKVDRLHGLKENVIVGRLIPAGTGAALSRLKVAANSRDVALRASQASRATALPKPEAA